MAGDTWAAQTLLEGAVELCLENLKDEGRVVRKYHLLRSNSYPDFWVLDSRDREWLIECKNTKGKRVPRNKYLGFGDLWLHNLNWTKSQILSKAWNESQYVAPLPNKGREIIFSHSPKPVLVTTNILFTPEAVEELRRFFGNYVIALGRQMDGSNPMLVKLYERLRQVFEK